MSVSQEVTQIEYARTGPTQNAQTLRNIADALDRPDIEIEKIEEMSGNLLLVKKSLDATIDRYKRHIEKS